MRKRSPSSIASPHPTPQPASQAQILCWDLKEVDLLDPWVGQDSDHHRLDFLVYVLLLLMHRGLKEWTG